MKEIQSTKRISQVEKLAAESAAPFFIVNRWLSFNEENLEEISRFSAYANSTGNDVDGFRLLTHALRQKTYKNIPYLKKPPSSKKSSKTS